MQLQPGTELYLLVLSTSCSTSSRLSPQKQILTFWNVSYIISSSTWLCPSLHFFLIFPCAHQSPQLRDWTWLRHWAEELEQGLKVQAWRSQSIHFHNSFPLERGKYLHRNKPGIAASLALRHWHTTSPLASNIWANTLRTFAKLILRVVGNTNKHMHKYSHGQMGHTRLFCSCNSLPSSGHLFISLTCCHLLLALLLLQVTRASPWF